MGGARKPEVLIVDADSDFSTFAARVLGERFTVSGAANADEGLALLRARRPAVILADSHLPKVSGLELLTFANDIAPDTVRVMVTAHADLDLAVRAINRARVTSFLTKPITPGDLTAAIETAARAYGSGGTDDRVVRELEQRNRQLSEQGRALEHSLEARSRELVRAQRDLEGLLVRDELTGLFNERSFQERAEEEIKRARRYHLHLGLLLCDVDAFQAFNEQHGRASGDRALVTVAQLLVGRTRRLDLTRVRETDFVACYGAGQFVVLLPETDKAGARKLAERLRRAVEQLDIPVGTGRGHLTMSFGVAAFPDDADSRGELIERADQALYQAKRAGKNRVCVSGEP